MPPACLVLSACPAAPSFSLSLYLSFGLASALNWPTADRSRCHGTTRAAPCQRNCPRGSCRTACEFPGHRRRMPQYTVYPRPPPPVRARACPNTATPCLRTFGSLLDPSFCGSNPIENAVCSVMQGCGTGPCGCQSVGVAVIPCALGRALARCFALSCFEGWRWRMSTCVPCDVPHGNTAHP